MLPLKAVLKGSQKSCVLSRVHSHSQSSTNIHTSNFVVASYNQNKNISQVVDILICTLILSTFASVIPLIVHSRFLVVIWIPYLWTAQMLVVLHTQDCTLMVHMPAVFNFLMSATFCNK